MTPSEKKARELCKEWLYGECWSEGIIIGISEAIVDAERRGFERAKRMACKRAEDFDPYKRPCFSPSHDSRFCGYCEGKEAGVDELSGELENLKYEDSHDEA